MLLAGLGACSPAAAEGGAAAPEGLDRVGPVADEAANEGAQHAGALVVPDAVGAWWPEITAAADRHGLPPDLVALWVWLESNGEPEATSPTGAKGLMQLMPATAARVAADRGEPEPSAAELADPERNLELGCAHLVALMAELSLDPAALDGEAVHLLAVAYNGGMAALRAWQDGAPLREETQAYAAAMRERWEARDQATP